MPMKPRPTLDEFFMGLLDQFASRSTCPRRQVACIITDVKGHILSGGYNGSPAGLPHCIDVQCPGANDRPGDSSRCIAVHAEQNALLQCFRLDLAHSIYVHATPCFTCAKLICNTPIQRVIYREQYADQDGYALMKKKGIKLDQFPNPVNLPNQLFQI